MIKLLNNKKVLTVSACAILLICFLFCGIFNIKNKVNAMSVEKLITVNEMSLETDKSSPIDGMDDNKKGLLLSSYNEGANANINLTFHGSSELDFRVYSDTTFPNNPTGAFWNSNYNDSYMDLGEVAFTFSEIKEDGKSFTVYLRGGCRYNVISPTARVKIGNAQVGLNYNKSSETPQDTLQKNRDKVWTTFWGTSFCNTASDISGILPHGGHYSTIGFDNENMLVYGVDYSSGIGKKRVILDLTDASIIGKRNVIDDFGEYTIKIEMTKINEGKLGKLLLYSINKQSLSGSKIINDMGSVPIVKVSEKAVLGLPYNVPVPCKSFDIFDGVIENPKYNVRCFAPNKSSVVIENNQFIPWMTGQYKLIYTTEDKQGKIGPEKILFVDVIKSGSPILVIENEDFYKNNRVIGKDTTINIVGASGKSLISMEGNAQIDVTISIDGGEKHFITGDYPYKFNGVGIHDITYRTVDNSGNITEITRYIEVRDDVPSFIGGIAPSKLVCGKEFKIPNKECKINDNILKYKVETTMPNGKIVEGTNILPEDAGTYEIKYITNYNGKDYSVCEYFSAIKDVGGLFTAHKDSEILSDDNLPEYLKDYNGVMVRANRANSGVIYNGIVNLKNSDKDNPFIRLMAVPQTKKAEMSKIYITLRDVENPSVFMKIAISKNIYGYNACSHISVLTSSYNKFISTQYGGSPGYHEDGPSTGSEIWHLFDGEEGYLKQRPISLYYDANENALYAGDTSFVWGKLVKVIDLDDDKNIAIGNRFTGFRSGIASVEITVDELSSSSADFLILSIGDRVFDNKYVKNDYKGPELYIDINEKSENMPVGMVGIPFYVFDYTFVDGSDGVVDGKVDIYRGGNLFKENCKYFIPTLQGEYSIVYTAKDFWNNITRKSVTVNVVDEERNFNIEFSEATMPESVEVGEMIEIPQIVSVKGGSGEITHNSYVVYGNKVISDDMYFTPSKAGTYKILYVVKDYLGSCWYEYKLVVTEKENIIPDIPVVPEVMMNGRSYMLPDLNVGKTQIDIVYNGKTTTLKDDFTFIPEVKKHGDKIKVVYKNISDKQFEWTKTFEVAVVKPENITQYFYTENLNVEYGNILTTYKVKDTTKSAKMSFVNKLYSGDLSVYFKVLDFSADEIAFYIMDCNEYNQRIKVSYRIYQGKPSVFINNKFVGNYGDSFENRAIMLRYDSEKHNIYDDEGYIFSIDTYANGSKFEGFSSENIYITMEINGVKGSTAIDLLKVVNQTFVNTDIDRVAPLVKLKSKIKTTSIVGSFAYIPVPYAYDVLSEYSSAKVIIKGPDRKVIFDEENMKEDYMLKFELPGKYSISYVATDGKMEKTYNYYIEVRDNVLPEINLDGNLPEVIKKGETLNLPVATASDNYTKDLEVKVYIVGSNMVYQRVNDNKWIFSNTGKYEIIYCVADDAGNIAKLRHTIFVL